MLIAEMLLLVALDDTGRVPVGSGALVQVGLTGALLAELAIDGRLAVAEDGTVRAAGTRPGNELLADAWDAVREHLQGRNVRHVIGGLSHHIGGSRDRVAGRLAGAGVLGRDRPSLLRPARYLVLDTAARQAAVDQVRAAAAGQGPVSARVAVVLALIGPCRLLERVAPDPGTRGEARRRIDRVTAHTPLAPGAAAIVDELIVAITVTATTVPPSFLFLPAGRGVLIQRTGRPARLPGEPYVTFQVRPFRYGGHAADDGTSTIMRFPETNLHDVACMQYLTGKHFADMPEDAGHYSAVMERLPVTGTPPDRTAEILADMLREILESGHVSTDPGR